MSKMPCGKFMLGDGFACMFSNAVLFSFSFFLGKNIQHFFNQFKFMIFIGFILLVLIFWYSKKRIKKANMEVIEKKLRDK
jgi:membrane protein DedA with SNARE-associated domain